MSENVARHIVTPKPSPAPTVACHTEGVDIQKQPIQATEADRRAVDRFVKDLETTGLLGNATVRVKQKKKALTPWQQRLKVLKKSKA